MNLSVYSQQKTALNFSINFKSCFKRKKIKNKNINTIFPDCFQLTIVLNS